MSLARQKRRQRKIFSQKATVAPARGTPPTAAQTHWLQENQNYSRMSHLGHLTRFRETGTLHADGTFVPSSVTPVIDSNAAFGVGIPVTPRKRRR